MSGLLSPMALGIHWVLERILRGGNSYSYSSSRKLMQVVTNSFFRMFSSICGCDFDTTSRLLVSPCMPFHLHNSYSLSVFQNAVVEEGQVFLSLSSLNAFTAVSSPVLLTSCHRTNVRCEGFPEFSL